MIARAHTRSDTTRMTRLSISTVVPVLLAFGLVACGGESHEPASSTAPVAALKGHGYSTTAFDAPFDVTVPDWLPAEVTTDSSHFVTWQPQANEDPAVRVLLPVAVYKPGDRHATRPPTDYLHYLLSQSTQGASFTGSTRTTIDGKPATILTATARKSLDGSLGCAATDLSAGDCFGLQPDLTLRIAVIEAGGHTLLIWLRHHGAANTKDASREFASFGQMLATIRFRSAPPSSPTVSSAASSVDGIWRTTITKAALASSPLLEDREEINDENYGDFTLTFGHGRFELTQTTAPRTSISGQFTLNGDAIRFDLTSGERFDMRFSVKGHVLAFTRDDTLGEAPTPLVLNPWDRS